MDYKRAVSLFDQPDLFSVVSSYLKIFEVARMAHAFRWPRLLKGYRARNTPLGCRTLFDPRFVHSQVLPVIVVVTGLPQENDTKRWFEACKAQCIPTSVVEVAFTSYLPSSSALSLLPPSVTCLRTPDYYVYDYDEPLSRLPPFVCSVILGKGWNEDLVGLHEGVTVLKILSSGLFNRPLLLPSTLTELYVCSGYSFNQPVDDLPSCLSTLIIRSKRFNQSLANLPQSLTNLHIDSHAFDQPLDDLPSSLTRLAVRSSAFSRPIHSLPPLLINLHLEIPKLRPDIPSQLSTESVEFFCFSIIGDSGADFPFLNYLPNSVRDLRIQLLSPYQLQTIPSSLTALTLGGPITVKAVLPRSLVQLHFLDYFEYSWDVYFRRTSQIVLPDFPTALLSLALPSSFCPPLQDFPASVTRLAFHQNSSFNRPLPPLPARLRVLILGASFTQPLPPLPSGLLVLDLRFARYFNYPLNDLPATLQILRLGEQFRRSLLHLPPSLMIFELRSSHPGRVVLPDSVTELSWARGLALPEKLPSSLRILRLSGDDWSTPDLRGLLHLPYIKVLCVEDSEDFRDHKVVRQLGLRVVDHLEEDFSEVENDIRFPVPCDYGDDKEYEQKDNEGDE